MRNPRLITRRWMVSLAIPGFVVDYARVAGRSLRMREQAAVHSEARQKAEASREDAERTLRAALGKQVEPLLTAADIDRVVASTKADVPFVLPRLRRLHQARPHDCYTESFWFTLKWGRANELVIYHADMERTCIRAARYPWLYVPTDRPPS